MGNIITALSGDTAVTNTLDQVLGGVSKVVEFSGTMLNTMLANPIYLFLFASSLVGVGVSIFLTFKHAARA